MNPYVDGQQCSWHKQVFIENSRFICGYCGDKVSSNLGYPVCRHSDASGEQVGGVYICPNCGGPTFFTPWTGEQLPGHPMGHPVKHVPEELEALYNEARECTSNHCYTAAVMVCRKILMNIAVDRGADAGLRFIEYVNYLSDNGYIPPNGRHWVDHIRQKGNEANHEISIMQQQDAEELVVFVEMLLRFIHEFPSMVPQPEPATE